MLKDKRRVYNTQQNIVLEIESIEEVINKTKGLIVATINSENEFELKEAIINKIKEIGTTVEEINELNEAEDKKCAKELYQYVKEITTVIPENRKNYILKLNNGGSSYLTMSIINKLFNVYDIKSINDLVGDSTYFKVEFVNGNIYYNIVIDDFLVEGVQDKKPKRKLGSK